MLKVNIFLCYTYPAVMKQGFFFTMSTRTVGQQGQRSIGGSNLDLEARGEDRGVIKIPFRIQILLPGGGGGDSRIFRANLANFLDKKNVDF